MRAVSGGDPNSLEQLPSGSADMAEADDRTRVPGIGEMSSSSSVADPPAERDGGRPRLGDLRSHLTCVICAGYFIDATTIVECLHTFCRSCILRHLEASAYCPICEVKIHRTKGAFSLRADRILQTLVYKMVPDLFSQEMRQRRHFYEQKPYADPELPSWAKGDVASYVPHVFTPDEHLQLRLAMFDAPDKNGDGSTDQCGTTGVPHGVPPVRYLRCQAGTPLTVLHKFIRNKFQLPPSIQVQLISGQYVLPDDVTLMDLGYTGHLGQNGITRLSFRLVRERKRPATLDEPTEAPALKTPRLEIPSSEADVVLSTPVDVSVSGPAEPIPASPTASGVLPTEANVKEVTCPGPGPPETFTAEAKSVSASPSPVNERLSPVPSAVPSPSPTTKPSSPDVRVPQELPVKSPVLSTSTDILPNVITPAVSLAPATNMAALSVTVRAESMFDPDDEEPTSPQVVQDIIASLDAEEEDRPIGHKETEAGSSGDSGFATAGALRVAEDVSRRKPDGTMAKQAIGEVRKDAAKTVNGEANVCNGNEHDEKLAKAKVASGQSVTSHNLTHAKQSLAAPSQAKPSQENVETSNESRSLSVISNLPNRTSSVASVPRQGILTGNVRGQVTTDSISMDGAKTSFQPNGQSGNKTADHVANAMQASAREVQTRDGPSKVVSAALTNGAAADLTKHANGTSNRRRDVAGASEARSEKQLASTTNPGSFNASNNKSAPPPSPTPVIKRPVQSPSSSKEWEQAHKKHVTNYGRPPSSKDTSRTSAATNSSLASSQSVIKSSARHASGEVGPASSERMNTQAKSAHLDLRSPSPKQSTTPHGALNVPKVQHTIHNMTNQSSAHFPNQKYDHIHSVIQHQGYRFDPHNVKFTPNSAPKRCNDEPVGPTKRTKIQHYEAEATTALDLSNPAKKTVAADSTSMLSGSPAASPKPSLPKLKCGKSQDIHSIVDSLANREHISLTAISNKTPSQAKYPLNYSKESKFPEMSSKSSSSHIKIAGVTKKASQQQSRTPVLTSRKPSYHSQPPVSVPSPMSPHRPLPMSLPMPESASCYFPPGGLCSPPLHVDTALASRLSYDMAMRNLLTLSHMAMAQGGMVRPPHHMFPMQHMFPPRPKSHDFHPIPDPSLLRQQSEAARMGASAKKASPTAGTTAPQLRSPTALTSASIQHMEDLSRTVGKRTGTDHHSVTLTPIPFNG